MMLKTRFVVPVDRPAIENGAVIIQEGRIQAVGPAARLREKPVIDYGDAVICPGFVNAHTHLELTAFAAAIPPSHDFLDWLRRLTGILTAAPPDRGQVESAVRQGIGQALACGVTTVGDITRSPHWTRPVLGRSALRAVSFGEIIAIGRIRERLHNLLAAAASVEHRTGRLQPGISPHTPYTVEPDGLRTCAHEARRHRLPLCIHLAETAHEDPFTRSLDGPLADYLHDVGVWDESIPAGGCNPVELASETGLLTESTLIAHANFVTDRDIARIADAGAAVAYCPRTHHAFGHPPHRFRDMLRAGINVCIGTDSLASNPSLSILDEFRFIHRAHPGFSPDRLLAMGTIRGAQALGWENEIGSILPGKSADLTVIPLDPSSSTDDWTAIFQSDRQPIATWIQGDAHENEEGRS
jgi:cytosine/adenosine deaminase-related metal-dependent hydrolase